MEGAINFPEAYAAAINVLIGFVFVVIMFILEIPLAFLRKRLKRNNIEETGTRNNEISGQAPLKIARAFYYKGLNAEDWIRLIFNDVVFLICFMGEGFLWLGLWYLDVEYLISDLMKGGWLNHILGTVFLICFQVMSYGGICGCAFDLDFPNEINQELYVYPNHFVRYFKKIKQESKNQATLQEGVNNAVDPSSECNTTVV